MNADKTPVKEAFSSNLSVLSFIAFTILLLSLPTLTQLSGRLTARPLYSGVTSEAGDYQYLYKQIYEDRSDIDVLFVGGCQMWCGGIRVPLYQKELTKALGEKKTVVAIVHPWRGQDADHKLLKDLLSHRRVRLAVIQDPSSDKHWTAWPEKMSEYWFSLGDWDSVSGLPFVKQASMYAQLVLGAPRKVLSLFRENGIGTYKNSCEKNCGTIVLSKGWQNEPFQFFSPKLPDLKTDDLFFSKNGAAFAVSNDELDSYQMHFLKSNMALLQLHKIPVVFMHFPELIEPGFEQVPLRSDWLKMFGKNVDILGIPPKIAFGGMTKDQIKSLYYDDFHLNANGGEYISKIMIPGVIDAYRKATISQ